MPDDDPGFTMGFFFGEVELTREDFGNDIRDWIAFQIAYTAATRCFDKAAALQLLRATSDGITAQVIEGMKLWALGQQAHSRSEERPG